MSVSISAIRKEISSIAQLIGSRDVVHVKVDGSNIHFPEKEKRLKAIYGDSWEDNRTSYCPSKTGSKFHSDKSRIKAIVGPVGSGKSTICCMDVMRLACSVPKCVDGIRRSRWAIIRNTYPELETTTLQTWKHWFSDIGSASVKMASPISYFSRFNTEDSVCEIHVLFLALDKDDDIGKLQSLELTGAYINEARYVPEIVLTTLMQRIGRYPSKSMVVGEVEPTILLDTNPCDTDYWFYRRFEEERPSNHFIAKQPPGLIKTETGYKTNPEADNINNLRDGYYTDAAIGVPFSEVNVQLLGNYGSFSTGDRVFTSYNDDVHAVDNIEFKPGLPVYIGWDYGLTPTAIFCQFTSKGQLQVIKEFCSENTFLEEFLDVAVLPFVREHLQGYKLISVGDPSGVRAGDHDGKSCKKTLEEKGIPTKSALSNSIVERLGAVNKLLTRMSNGYPAFVVSKVGAPRIRKAFQEKYCYKVIAGKKTPEKNEYSHGMDGLQYVCLEIVGLEKKPAASKEPPKMIASGWA